MSRFPKWNFDQWIGNRYINATRITGLWNARFRATTLGPLMMSNSIEGRSNEELVNSGKDFFVIELVKMPLKCTIASSAGVIVPILVFI